MLIKYLPFSLISQMLMAVACIFLLVIGCKSLSDLQKAGLHYQKENDYQSLQQVVDQLPDNSDKSVVRSLLGEPIDMGFDYRYLLDSIGPNGCVVGAVFHINQEGIIDDKWIGEICE